MQRSVATLLAIALATGCSARTGGKIGTGVGLGLIATSVALSLGAGGPGGETDPEDWAFIPRTAGALVLVPSLVLLLASNDDTKEGTPLQPKPEPGAEKRAADREQAWQMTKLAARAARDGDCPSVIETGKLVANLDADLHATVFVRDAAIARCLAPATP